MTIQTIQSKIKSNIDLALPLINEWKKAGQSIVFTNGCFDLLHYGHFHYLAEARDLGDKLIVGLNSQHSVRRLKGSTRPINDELTRTHILASLQFVDLVILFEQDTPIHLITAIKPQVLVKGGDYIGTEIVGYNEVSTNGGQVKILPFVEGYSSSLIIEQIQNLEHK